MRLTSRITHQTIARQAISDMQRNLRGVEEKRSQLVSGRRLSRSSDDPVGVARTLGFQNRLAEIKQHTRNSNQILARLNQTESVLDGTNETLMQLKQLALQYGSATVSPRDRLNAVEQIQQIKQQVIQFANTKSGNQYIFAGSKTTTRPFEDEGDKVRYRGNNKEVSVEIGENQTIPVNIPGTQVFNTSQTGIFQMLTDFTKALEQDNIEEIQEIVGRIENFSETVLTGRAINAARTQRVEFSREGHFDDEFNTIQSLSDIQGTDMARAATELVNQQTAYQAALVSTARVIQPSLLSVLG
ncbi:flagellar hook-associated protein FlgL [Candidatus Poribacteria bacterium]|nr:flagellar hook-associated protein FlgL [Candidatus Poribacteria bacterium]